MLKYDVIGKIGSLRNYMVVLVTYQVLIFKLKIFFIVLSVHVFLSANAI